MKCKNDTGISGSLARSELKRLSKFNRTKSELRQATNAAIWSQVITFNNDTFYFYFFYTKVYFLENRKLRDQIAALKRENERLGERVKTFDAENRFLVRINEAFADENDVFQERLTRITRHRLPISLQKSDDNDGPSAKRRKSNVKAKSKGKKPVHYSDDELDDSQSSLEGNETEHEEKNEKGARVCLL